MKKFIWVLLSLSLVLIGCSEEKKAEQGEFNQESAVIMAERLSSIVYSGSTKEELKELFKSYKKDMTSEAYEEYFDMDQLHVQNHFAFDFPVVGWEKEEVFVEKLDTEMNVVVVARASFDVEEVESEEDHEGHMHEIPPMEKVVVDVYRFNQDGKLIGFNGLY